MEPKNYRCKIEIDCLFSSQVNAEKVREELENLISLDVELKIVMEDLDYNFIKLITIIESYTDKLQLNKDIADIKEIAGVKLNNINTNFWCRFVSNNKNWNKEISVANTNKERLKGDNWIEITCEIEDGANIKIHKGYWQKIISLFVEDIKDAEYIGENTIAINFEEKNNNIETILPYSIKNENKYPRYNTVIKNIIYEQEKEIVIEQHRIKKLNSKRKEKITCKAFKLSITSENENTIPLAQELLKKIKMNGIYNLRTYIHKLTPKNSSLVLFGKEFDMQTIQEYFKYKGNILLCDNEENSNKVNIKLVKCKMLKEKFYKIISPVNIPQIELQRFRIDINFSQSMKYSLPSLFANLLREKDIFITNLVKIDDNNYTLIYEYNLDNYTALAKLFETINEINRMELTNATITKISDAKNKFHKIMIPITNELRIIDEEFLIQSILDELLLRAEIKKINGIKHLVITTLQCSLETITNELLTLIKNILCSITNEINLSIEIKMEEIE